MVDLQRKMTSKEGQSMNYCSRCSDSRGKAMVSHVDPLGSIPIRTGFLKKNRSFSGISTRI